MSNLLECYSVQATKSQVQTSNKPCKWEKEEESKEHLKLFKGTIKKNSDQTKTYINRGANSDNEWQ